MGAISFSLDQGLLDELLRVMPLELFLETGTFQGETLALVRPKFRQCISIELSEKHYAAARTRFAGNAAVDLLLGDSARLMEGLRGRFAGTPTLFWLDAHWCAAEDAAGERSQCPLLAELAAIGQLAAHSVVAIDDARFFLSPPPQPHEISDWPDFDDVLRALQRLSNQHALACFNDILLFVPRPILPKIRPYLHQHGFNLLSYADKARGYDALLEQTRAKERELVNVHDSAREREQALRKSMAEANHLREQLLAKEEDRLAAYEGARLGQEALQRSAAEADRLRAEAAELVKQLATKEADRLGAHADAERLRAQATDLSEQLATKEADRLGAHAEAEQSRAQATDLNAQLVAKERVIQSLARTCDERMDLINKLAFTGERPLANAAKVASYRLRGPLDRLRRTWQVRSQAWLCRQTPYHIAKLVQYDPRPMKPERFPSGRPPQEWPRICIITPSYNQAQFLVRTMESVLSQGYPKLAYGVQDGGSTDDSTRIITERISRLTHAESAPDEGQADAIQKGFRKLYPANRDIMAWLNSDDVLMPGTLEFVGRYFATHPEVDVLYGHRVIIDEHDREVGRWFMPRHHADTLRWFDLVPQETLFWRAKCLERIGGLDPSFHFAMDWDLLVRFEEAGFHIHRVPYFLGCFRVHTAQKTSTRIHTLGEQEMTRIRRRTHGRDVAHWEIHEQLDAEIGRSALVAMMARFGFRH